MASTSTKLKMKVGEFEFEAEGPAEAVAEQFKFWKQMISEGGAQFTAVQGAKTPAKGADVGATGVTEPAAAKGSNRALQNLFDVNHKTGIVSLHVRPRGDTANADSIVLLLYGFKELLGQEYVLVTKLAPAVRKSGLPIVRVDRLLEGHLRDGLVQKGGARKGGKYSLSNTGIAKAKEIVSGLKG